jgi:predicted ABC-type ATPase
MTTMFIYRGIPGSGKTTQAMKDQHLYGGVLVGRDHIRKGLGITGVGTPEQENQITALQNDQIHDAFENLLNVFVDDMNLKDSYVTRLKTIARSYGADVSIVDLRDVDVETAVARAKDRAARGGREVPEELIRDLHRRFVLKQSSGGKHRAKPGQRKGMPEFYQPEPHIRHADLEDAVIIDLDGTTALKSEYRGFYDYDERVSLDLPNQPIIRMVRGLINSGLYPVFLSGRMDSCADATRLWIQKHVYCGSFDLYMRKTGDTRPDYVVKDEMFARYVQGHFNVELAIDDRNQVVDLWRAKGIPAIQVADGNF